MDELELTVELTEGHFVQCMDLNDSACEIVNTKLEAVLEAESLRAQLLESQSREAKLKRQLQEANSC